MSVAQMRSMYEAQASTAKASKRVRPGFQWTPLTLQALPKIATEVDEVIYRLEDLLASPSVDEEELALIRHLVRERVQELQTFYFECQNDGRAILLEKQRLKLRAALQRGTEEAEVDMNDQRPFPHGWRVPLRGAACLTAVREETAHVQQLVDSFAQELSAGGMTADKEHTLALYRSALASRAAELEVFGKENPTLATSIERERLKVKEMAQFLDTAARPSAARKSMAGQGTSVSQQPSPVQSPFPSPSTASALHDQRQARRGTHTAASQRPGSPQSIRSRRTVAAPQQKKERAPLLEFKVVLTQDEYEEYLRRRISNLKRNDFRQEDGASFAPREPANSWQTRVARPPVPMPSSSLGDVLALTEA